MNARISTRFRFSLANRLLLFVILLGILPVLVVGLVGLWLSAQNLQTSDFTLLSEHTESIQYQLQEWLEFKKTLLSTMVASPQVAQDVQEILVVSSDETVRRQIQSLRNFWSQSLAPTGFSRLMLLNADGVVLVSTDVLDEGKRVPHQMFFQEGLKGTYVSPPFYDQSRNLYLIVISQPIKADNLEAIHGVLAGFLEFSQVNQFLNVNQLLWQTTETYLVAGNFAALTPLRFVPDPTERYFVRTEGTRATIQQKISGVSVYPNYRGIPVVGVYRWLPDLQIAIISEVDRTEAFAEINAFVQSSLFILVGTLVVAVGVGGGIARSISQPIRKLSTSAQALSAGDLSQRTNIQRTDEIGALAQSFDMMAERLSGLIATLEQRVAERTKALATAGEISRRISSILDRQTLAVEVVQQLQNAFGYYHAHIYLLDETGETLVMTGGTGNAGKLLLERGHKLPIGRGLVGRAVAQKQVVLVPDTTANPDWLPNPLLPETKSEIAVPILAGTQVFGVLDVQNNVVNSLGEQDADLIRIVADQVAIGLQNILAAELIARRAAQLEIVANISTTISKINDLDEIYRTVTHLTQRRFGFYHVHIFIFNPVVEELSIVACSWKAGDPHEGTHGTMVIPLHQQQSLVARAARTRQPVLVNDVHREPDWLPNQLLPDTVAELAVPLFVGDELIGVFDIQSERRNAFTEEDANVQSVLAAQIATAIQNARLLSQAQRQAQRESALNTIAQRIQSATTISETLQIAVREIGYALGKKPALITLESLDSRTDAQSN